MAPLRGAITTLTKNSNTKRSHEGHEGFDEPGPHAGRRDESTNDARDRAPITRVSRAVRGLVARLRRLVEPAGQRLNSASTNLVFVTFVMILRGQGHVTFVTGAKRPSWLWPSWSPPAC